MAFLIFSLLSPHPTKPLLQNTVNSETLSKPTTTTNSTKRDFLIKTSTISISSLAIALQFSLTSSIASAQNAPPKPLLSEIVSTKTWFQYYGSGFSIRIPPMFVDKAEPEDYNAGMSLYGDKAKTKTYAARFESSDGYEVVSVLTRATNSLKITFLEAKDISDLGSLKTVARIFVPGGATLYSARIIKIKEEEGIRNYYFYEYGLEYQHFAVVVAVSGGKAYIAGASAPESRWEEDGVKLRSAAISLSLL
ncbi:hypothetical protein C5167_012176 [Papaver somniferum]|uniref:PsbP C-terminal domain-containing protein n=1 Tax=Papaver somniferum TaxID=3469 RepID=A0A4Y7IWP0_PAPSO|nr:uncharacterized protein LOC113355385 [Papaver somniferum]RZC53304.1 hypothetical protein C5167_012176 [Papaver somniferum]